MPRYPQEDVRRVGTALIGGDFIGNARGNYAIDVQSGKNADRGGPILTEVASGIRAVAYGFGNEASGDYAIAIGYANVVSGESAIAIGRVAIASAISTLAIGLIAEATAAQASAIGYRARARLANTINLSGLLIIQKDTGGLTPMQSFAGAEVIILTDEIDLKVVADQTITLTAGSKFWWNECGIIATDIFAIGGEQPTVRFGITGDLDKQVVAAITTDLAATGDREIETPLVPKDGETSLTAGVTNASTYNTCKGRFYWKGMFVEDE